MKMPLKFAIRAGLVVLIGVPLAGCESVQGIGRDFKAAFSKDSKTPEAADAVDGNTVAEPKSAAKPKSAGALPGMNARGEVIDPKLVEAGNGTKVKGIDEWEGEITGKPVRGSKFSKLKIGMPMKQVTDLAGEPTDKGAHVTGKAFIPFFFGSDSYRYELVYKGHGRLLFAGGSVSNIGGGNLIWIIHSAKEKGYR